MLLKERVMDPRERDEISEALGYTAQPETVGGRPYRVVPAYVYHWYPTGEAAKTLKERTVGPHSRQLVGFSRYYPTLDPRVVVDFEPEPPEKFYEQEKRQWCIEQRLVYVPIHLGAKMSTEGFQDLVAACRKVMESGGAVLMDEAALKQVDVEQWLQTQELMTAVDQRVFELVEDDQRRNGKLYRGVSRQHMLRKYKEQEITALREELRSGRLVDPLDRYRQPAQAAE